MIGWSIFEQNARFLTAVGEIDFPSPPEWATPHQVAFRLDTLRLLDFGGRGKSVLVVAPYAGHSSTIADYDDGQSLVQVLLQAGHHVYCADWNSATPAMAKYGIEHYLKDLDKAIQVIGEPINLVGLCQGGWLAAMYACLNPVQSLVIAGAPLDTQAGNGSLKYAAETLPLSFFRWMVASGGGLMQGRYMLAGWKSMHPEEHYYRKYVDLYANSSDRAYLDRAKRFASWYEYMLDLPGAFYLESVELLFKKNLFFRGDMQLFGERVSLSQITSPVYLLAGAEDDITPPEQVLSAKPLLNNAEAEVVPGGHIGLFMGHDALEQYWTKIATWIGLQE